MSYNVIAIREITLSQSFQNVDSFKKKAELNDSNLLTFNECMHSYSQISCF